MATADDGAPQQQAAAQQQAPAQPPNGVQDEKKRLAEELALLQLLKGREDAATDLAKARTGGEVKGGAYSGAVELKERPGAMEATLLAARAVAVAAERVAAAVHAASPQGALVVVAAKQLPGFHDLAAFAARRDLLLAAFRAARVRALVAEAAPAPELAFAPPGAALLVGLDAASKLLGYLKTDFSIGGVELQLDEATLQFSVAGALAGRGRAVSMPALYDPSAMGRGTAEVASQLGELASLASAAAAEAASLEAQGTAAAKSRAERLKALVAAFDGFVAALTAPGTGGAVPLTAVAEQLALRETLRGATVVLVRLEATGGSFHVRKGLLSSIGGEPPLRHMGGATVSFLALDGATGAVRAGGVAPVHGGFVDSDRLRSELDSPIPAAR